MNFFHSLLCLFQRELEISLNVTSVLQSKGYVHWLEVKTGHENRVTRLTFVIDG